MDEKFFEKYIANRKPLIRVICRTRQWSGLEESNIYNWLENFKSTFGKYLAIKLLIHSIYYSEKDIITLLEYGIRELIHSKKIRLQLITDNNIYLPRSETNAILKNLIINSAFVPLLDDTKPGESANQMARYLIQKVSINPSQTYFINNLTDFKIKKSSSIIFLDDCIGSGNQLSDFFDRHEVKDKIAIAVQNKVPIYYLIISGYKKNIESIKSNPKFKNINIIACSELSDTDRVFNKNNIIWRDEDEYEKAMEYFVNLERNTGIEMYGHAGLDFSVFIHNTIPDWSLPLYWMENADWVPLMRRKNSNNF